MGAKKAADKYASSRTNLYLPEELVELAKEHFRNTRYKSLSGFVEIRLRQEIGKNATRLRKAGLKVPASVLTK